MIIVEAPIHPHGPKPEIPHVQIDEDTESVEWIKTPQENGTWKVTGYNIVKKQIFNG